MTKKRLSKKHSPQKTSNDSNEYRAGLSTAEKAERRRKLSAESYARHRSEIRERRRIAAAEKRAELALKKRRWDPPKKLANPANPAPLAPPSLPSSSIDGSYILPEATPSEYHQAWFQALSQEPPSLSARSLSLCAAAADVANAGDIVFAAGGRPSLTSAELVATQALTEMAHFSKKNHNAARVSVASSEALSLPRSTDRCFLLRPTPTTTPGITRVELGQALVAELNSGELTATTPDDAMRWHQHGGFTREEDWHAAITWQSLSAWRSTAEHQIGLERRRARIEGRAADEDLYLG
ncbi:hypothetical protein C8F04DRAFT_1190736 [Mycena alexandri]|uniref:Uncharacterized protein n=1 Tax=Mycena alexandri TaxID=1745969 RepID=A0AAD6SFD6_9AGAR|nr:hypothetical protein C8F04DRAFT_1190736 [Mycena alexandri]